MALPFTLPASWCWGYSRPRLGGPRGPGVVLLPSDPFASSCPSDLGSGGEHDPWLPGKRATSQATTLPESTLWRQKSEYSISPPSRRKHEQSQPCSCLRAFALTVSPAWHTLPRALCLAGSFSSFQSQRGLPGLKQVPSEILSLSWKPILLPSRYFSLAKMILFPWLFTGLPSASRTLRTTDLNTYVSLTLLGSCVCIKKLLTEAASGEGSWDTGISVG